MLFWILIAAITLAVLLFVLRPLVGAGRGAARRGDYDMTVYRSQIDELRAEEARGVISPAEARAARNEIERRMLQASRDAEPDVREGGGAPLIVGLVIAVAVPLGAGALYLAIGNPDLPAQPLAQRIEVPAGAARMAAAQPGAPSSEQGLESVSNMVGNLERRLEEDPENFEGWMLLGRSYGVMDRYGDAAGAYAKAAALPEAASDPAPHMQLGEALVFSSNGVVIERAQAAFRRAVEIDANHPGARYYLALARGQGGDLKGAYDGWVSLAQDSPADAPWLPALRERIAEVARDLDVEPPAELMDRMAAAGAAPGPSAPPAPARSGDAAAPGPSAEDIQAAQEMSADDRQAMIRGMVEGLAARLEENPDDYDGWMRLARARGVLGETDAMIEAYENAARLRPEDTETRLALAGALVDAGGDGPLSPRAVEAFRAVLEVDPDNPDALWFVGRGEAEAGRPEAAVQAWRKLLGTLAPGSDAHTAVQAQIERLQQGQ
ncbi:c-type cytochrome biogenesis protein CcmI [Minwuia thermotolerans]|uniref:C-type cytochrome biogenesis protein CcmI n=1 Tax=Minwuia thermotolerans TaxID=2056226 RepID=A0A2M9G5M8_9PROT|nr:c-type cytochrome biogenesis protein CcmI [Minwuia thermotolerans]PJK31023.1 c-type cytochrome biogenesis protein CcmI [Minwuia thermotolerans]